MAAAVAAATDHGAGHGPGPDHHGADLGRRLRMDLGRGRTPPHHTRTARQGPRRSPADALAQLGHRRPAGRRRGHPLPAGTHLRPRGRARPWPPGRETPGAASARQRHPLPGQPVPRPRAVRRTGWIRRPPSGRPLARHPPRQRQPHPGHPNAQVQLAGRHPAPLPDRRPDRRGPAPQRLDRHPAPLRPRLHRGPGIGRNGHYQPERRRFSRHEQPDRLLAPRARRLRTGPFAVRWRRRHPPGWTAPRRAGPRRSPAAAGNGSRC